MQTPGGGATQEIGLYAALLLTMLQESSAWITRRVEQVAFADDESVQIRVSLDYDLERLSVFDAYCELLENDALPLALLPFALIEKRPLEAFDLTDRDGKSLSLLTEQDTTPLSCALLRLQAENVLGRPTTVGARLDEFVSQRSTTTNSFVGFTKTPASQTDAEERRQLLDDEVFSFLAESLSTRFLGLAVLGEKLERRGMVKYAYTATVDWPQFSIFGRDARGLGQRLGWRTWRWTHEQPAVRLCASSHVEVTAPEGAMVRSLHLEGVEAGGKPTMLASRTGQLPRAHVNVRGSNFGDPAAYRAVVRLAPLRRGLVRNAFLGSLLPTLGLLAVALAHERIADRNLTNVVGVLLILPGLLATYTARPAEHPLVSRMCLGLRFTVLGLTALPALLIAALMALRVHADTLLVWSAIGLALSVVGVLALARTYVLAGRHWR